jgi:ribosomal protein S16
MSFWARRYVNSRRKRFRTEVVDFTKSLKDYRRVLVHPVMCPGKEVFSLHAVESIIDYKGKENVELLIDKKLEFFFQNITSKKIVYNDFISPFSSDYKDLQKNLMRKKYDIFVQLNQFSEDKMTMFGLVTRSKIRLCVDGLKDNPIYNMVVSIDENTPEVERNNRIIKTLGVKKVRKKIRWSVKLKTRKERKKVGIAVSNIKLGVAIASFLKERNFNTILFVNDGRLVEKLEKKINYKVLPVYPVDKIFEECSSCEFMITSMNPIVSVGYLTNRKVLLFLEKGEKFLPSDSHKIEICTLEKEVQKVLKRVKVFVEGK